jgi:hypothetical protein
VGGTRSGGRPKRGPGPEPGASGRAPRRPTLVLPTPPDQAWQTPHLWGDAAPSRAGRLARGEAYARSRCSVKPFRSLGAGLRRCAIRERPGHSTSRPGRCRRLGIRAVRRLARDGFSLRTSLPKSQALSCRPREGEAGPLRVHPAQRRVRRRQVPPKRFPAGSELNR